MCRNGLKTVAVKAHGNCVPAVVSTGQVHLRLENVIRCRVKAKYYSYYIKYSFNYLFALSPLQMTTSKANDANTFLENRRARRQEILAPTLQGSSLTPRVRCGSHRPMRISTERL